MQHQPIPSTCGVHDAEGGAEPPPGPIHDAVEGAPCMQEGSGPDGLAQP